MSEQIEIPNRALFKASEVCELLKVQPYVLRTWEAEFSDLGVAKGPSGARVYRREDIARVQRIKHLLLIEGLTLAGVRRKLEEEAEPPLEQEASALAQAPEPGLDPAARERIAGVRQGLRALLALLEARPGPSDVGRAGGAGGRTTDDEATFSLAAPVPASAADSGKGSRRASASDAAKAPSPRRKRSA